MFETHNPALPAPQDLQESAPRLEDLARQAREAHVAAGRAVNDAVGHALTAGRALIAAKEMVPDGQWVRWVQQNCDFTDRHARNYMALTRAYAASGNTVSGDLLGLSLRGALKRMTPPQPKPNAPPRLARSATPTTGLDIAIAWDAAPSEERRRAVNNIGLKPILAALPDEWLPAVERWIVERRRPAIASTISIATGADGFPELPDCLRRASATTHWRGAAMTSKLIDLTGMKFGRWTVLELHSKRMRYGSKRRSVQALWRCVCDCDGSERLVFGSNLRRGLTTSCGCLNREKIIARSTKHGHAKRGNHTRIYDCWVGMRQRCYNSNNRSHFDYGARGIVPCERWQTFVNLFADMGHPPPGKSLDRINVNGNYEPGNCRWATIFEQARNKRPLSFLKTWRASEPEQENGAAGGMTEDSIEEHP